MKLIVFWIISLGIIFPAYGKTLEGIVQDAVSRERLAYAAVHIEGTLRGSCCNADGYFSIETEKGDTCLIISRIGYKTQRVRILSVPEKFLVVKLAPEVYELEEYTVGTVLLSPEQLLRRVYRKLKSNYFSSSYQLVQHMERRKEEEKKQVFELSVQMQVNYLPYGRYYDFQDTLDYKVLKYKRTQDNSKLHVITENTNELTDWIDCDVLHCYSFQDLKDMFKFRFVEIRAEECIIEANQCRDTLQGVKRKDILYKKRYRFVVNSRDYVVKQIEGWHIIKAGDQAVMQEKYIADYTLWKEKYCMTGLNYAKMNLSKNTAGRQYVTYDYLRLITDF